MADIFTNHITINNIINIPQLDTVWHSDFSFLGTIATIVVAVFSGFALFNNNGQRFEPDFVLVCENKDEQEVLYQCFIEPKGAHLLQKDQWKEEFLQNSFSKKSIITRSNRKYKLIGMPFYNRTDGIGENKFEEMLDGIFEV